MELVEDHFNGGVIVRRSDGMCLTLKAYEQCEWASPPSGAIGCSLSLTDNMLANC